MAVLGHGYGSHVDLPSGAVYLRLLCMLQNNGHIEDRESRHGEPGHGWSSVDDYELSRRLGSREHMMMPSATVRNRQKGKASTGRVRISSSNLNPTSDTGAYISADGRARNGQRARERRREARKGLGPMTTS